MQPSAEELRKKQLASQLFGIGGGLSGPSRAPRHKRKGNQSKIEAATQLKTGSQSDIKTVTTDLLLDLQVCRIFIVCMYNLHVHAPDIIN